MKKLGVWALAAMALAMAGACSATGAKAQDWKALTRTDLDAAAALIRDNHPAMVPAIGDKAFVARFGASLAKARGRIDKVEDADGMAAVLRGFAAGLGDDHIAWGPKDGPPIKAWPGFMVARKGPDLAVTVTSDGAPPIGARLLDCDGVAARELLLRRTISHVTNPDVEAQLVINSIWTLLDDGDPFIPRPKTCRFDVEGQVIQQTLAYQPVTPEIFGKIRDGRRMFGHAGFGLRQVGQAWWVGVESFDQRAPAVIAEAQAKQAALRAAPLVVIDLRGNGGGSSLFGDELAAIVLGYEPVRALKLSGGPVKICPAIWRASPGNRASLEIYAQRFPDQAAYWRGEGQRMDAALAARQPLTGSAEGCQVGERKGPPPPHPLFAGKLVVITDAACFSSCPMVVKRLKDLGAIQVGQATNAPTRYMEVRVVDLPSGQGRFTTLQKAAMSSPPMIGPYAPDIPFPGDIADTQALEAWIPTVAR